MCKFLSKKVDIMNGSIGADNLFGGIYLPMWLVGILETDII